MKTYAKISLWPLLALSCAQPPILKPSCPTPGLSLRQHAASPQPVGALHGVADVVPLRERLCVRFLDGSVRCFGGHAGSVGDAACAEYAPLPELSASHDVAALSADCVRLRDGSARCWEEPRSGGAPVPAELPAFAGPLRQIVNGCAVYEADGHVQCWGERRGLGDVESLIGVEELAFSSIWKTGCARVFGRVQCWNDAALIALPAGAPPTALGRPRRVPGLRDVGQLAVGENFACALSAGQVACFGSNRAGQLGDGSRIERTTPQNIAGLTGVVQLAAGGDRVCARTADGRVACWGALPAPQGGNRQQLTPEWLPGLRDVRRIAVGPATLCLIAQDTTLHCWGEMYTPRIPADFTSSPPPPITAPLPDVDFPRRPPPPPGTLTCSDEQRYHYRSADGEMVYESEDECLDMRAWQKAYQQGRCLPLQHRILRHQRADGKEDWSCECAQGQCRSTDGLEAAPACGEHPETFEPLPPAAVAALCRAPLHPKSGASVKGRVRYCGNGAQQVIGDCRPPPGAHGCIAPRGHVPAWVCFTNQRECESNLATARKAGLRGIDPRCTVIQP